MIFKISEDHLRRLCQINSFKISGNGMVFFGFRGCMPVNDENHEFQKEHQLILADINNINPRCTLGQWLPQETLQGMLDEIAAKYEAQAQGLVSDPF